MSNAKHRMDAPASLLQRWKSSLPEKVSVGGAMAKNPTAYKWKAPYRSLVLREALFWRTYDLLSQAQLLHENHHMLGSRLLLRSALEAVATLAYLNQGTRALLDGEGKSGSGLEIQQIRTTVSRGIDEKW